MKLTKSSFFGFNILKNIYPCNDAETKLLNQKFGILISIMFKYSVLTSLEFKQERDVILVKISDIIMFNRIYYPLVSILFSQCACFKGIVNGDFFLSIVPLTISNDTL